MLTLLPNFILDDIFSYLDLESLCEVSLTCKQFHTLALPLIFRELTVYEASESEERKFLKKRGGLVKGLTLPRATVISDLRDARLSLKKVFPQLSALYIQTDYTLSPYFYGKFVEECMKATSLKHVSIFGRISGLSDPNMFAPVISKLDSVCFNSLPLFIVENPQIYVGLKRLVIPIEYLSSIPKFAKDRHFSL
ncbi:hypothetical protein DSO57_1029900 [Entomophthora muscae]|uniref:Uncharacterized protein n=1 Tax=Entomophthora muscae TaxID=34485 RepID=A0ACC2UL66_9FUNG|nr:hypothetical protein DSO57_1029900 [Entomophthora muscae]